MASIRRTLSPSLPNTHHQDRHSQTRIHIQIQRSSSSPSSPSSPLSTSINPSSPFGLRLMSVMRLLFSYNNKQPSARKSFLRFGRTSWKNSSPRFFLFFLLGFLIGLFPFAHLHHADLNPHHFFFDSKSLYSSTSNPHRNLGDVILDSEIARDAPPISTLPIPQKLLIIVTPTYNRAIQAYYLTRLGQTLRLVPPPLLWIVVEMESASAETADILRKSGVTYRHLITDIDNMDFVNIKDRGVHQRNTALRHMERHLLNGIVYFADDDNIYSFQLFHQLRNIRRFGTWPVAMLAQGKNKATLEGPVCNGDQVIGWHTNEKSKRLRRFHVDMSGFAFNSTILWDPKRWRRSSLDAIRQLDTVKEGFQETTFIEQVVEDESQMEGLPHDCSKIMNWHLHLEARHLSYPRGWQVSQNLEVVNSLR